MKEITRVLTDYVEGTLIMEGLENNTITMTLQEVLKWQSEYDKDIDKLEHLITKHYGCSFEGCNSDGQQKINELIKENIIVEFNN